MSSSSSRRQISARIRRQCSARRLTNAHAEWLIGDREHPSLLARLRQWLRRSTAS